MSQPHLKLEHEITEVNSDTSSEYQEEASLGLDGLLVLEDTLDRRKVSCTQKINHFVQPILVFGDI